MRRPSKALVLSGAVVGTLVVLAIFLWSNLTSGYLCSTGYRDFPVVCARHDGAKRAECEIDPDSSGRSWESGRINIRSGGTSGTVVASWKPPIVFDKSGRALPSLAMSPVSANSTLVDRNGVGASPGDTLCANATDGVTIEGFWLLVEAPRGRTPGCGWEYWGETYL